MSVELALSTSAVAWAAGRFPNRSPVLYLLPVLVLGRVFNAALNYFVATWMSLPGSFLAGASFLSGWPGIVLLLLTIPAFTRLFSAYRPPPARGTKGVAAR